MARVHNYIYLYSVMHISTYIINTCNISLQSCTDLTILLLLASAKLETQMLSVASTFQWFIISSLPHYKGMTWHIFSLSTWCHYGMQFTYIFREKKNTFFCCTLKFFYVPLRYSLNVNFLSHKFSHRLF